MLLLTFEADHHVLLHLSSIKMSLVIAAARRDQPIVYVSTNYTVVNKQTNLYQTDVRAEEY